jgi:protein-S-isoprenylcysteine O-methyltransferase Ste14
MGDLKNILSLILFCGFLAAYILKLCFLYKRDNIKANVLGKGKKNKDIKNVELTVKITTLIWGATWLIESLGKGFILDLVGAFTKNIIVQYIGIVVISMGLIIFISAMIFMKTSWRVGIDKQTKGVLITDGIYRYSRNPAFVGFDFMFLGLFLAFPNSLTLLVMVFNLWAIHRLILEEEKHLISTYGDSYKLYCTNTRRYM